MDSLVTFVPLLLIAVVFYAFIIRPGKARQQRAREVLDQMQPGDQVMTTAGLFATVVAVHDDRVELEPSPGQRQTYLKRAIAEVIKPDDVIELDAAEPTRARTPGDPSDTETAG